jgi:integrase
MLYDTKNGRPRGVPVNRVGYDALIALQPDSAKRTGSLFRSRKIRTAFEKALERAELKNMRFHDLRHTAASHLVMRGAALKEVQEILGHRTYDPAVRPPLSVAPAERRRPPRWTHKRPGFSSTRLSTNTVESAECAVSPCRAVSSDGRAPDF